MKKDLNRTGATLCSSMRPRSATTLWLKFKLLAFAFMALLSINVWGATAPVNTVLWGENFAHFGTKTPSSAGTGTGTTIYDNASITYSQDDTGTKGYNETYAGGTAPELLLKSGKIWTISGIKTGGAKTLSLEYLSNNTKSSVSCSTSGVSVSGSSKSYTIKSSTPGAALPETIILVFGCSGNTRLDNVVLKVTEAGSSKKTVDYKLTNVTGDSDNPDEVDGSEDLDLYFTAEDGYNCPDAITVKVGTTTLAAGTDYTWEAADEMGNLQIPKAKITGNITITIAGVEAPTGAFHAGETLFLKSQGEGAWGASSCVKVWFHGGTGNALLTPTWMYNEGNTTYKMFYVIVPAGAEGATQAQLQRFAENCSTWWNSNGDANASDRGDKNTIKTVGTGESDVSWHSDVYHTYLKGSVDSWSSDLAIFTDNSNGNFVATVSNAAPSGTIGDAASYEFRTVDGNGRWYPDANVTLSGLKAGSTYNIQASFNIGSRGTLNLTPTLVKASVRFDANGHGTAPSNMTNITPNAKISEPTAPSASGWRFDGWYTAATGGTQWNFSTSTVTESMVLYAHWTQLQSYTVTFNNNGVQSSTQQVVEGGTVSSLPTLAAAQAPISGYTFIGWVNNTNAWSGFEAEMTQALITGNEVINANVTYDAVWAKVTNNYEVVREAAGLTAGNYVIDGYDDDDETEEAMDNTFAGKTFPTEDHGVISTTDNSIIWNVTIKNGQYALKNLSTNTYFNFTNTYDLTLSSTAVYLTISGEVVDELYEVDLNNGSKHLEYDGGKFDSWNSAYNTIYFYKQKINNYFVTPPAQITVTWHIGNGTQTATTYDGTAFAELTAPEVDDNAIGDCVNKFMGWATAAITKDEATKEDVAWADETTISNSNKDFYAVFAQAEGSGDDTPVTIWSETFGDAGTTSAAEVSSYDGFSGKTAGLSYSASGIKVSKSNSNTCNLSGSSGLSNLYVSQSGQSGSFTVSGLNTEGYENMVLAFNLKFGGGSNQSISVTANGTSLTIDGSNPSGTSWQSVSYSSGIPSASSLTLVFTEGSNGNSYIDDISLIGTGSTTYSNYATSCPELKYATIHFDANGKTLADGSMPADMTNAVVGRANTLPGCSATVTGYTFAGWSATQSGEVITEYTPADEDQTYTMYAIWQVNSHTLTWDLDGGTAGTGTITPAGSVAYGTVLQYTVEPTKGGKKFNGWSPEMISGTTTMPDNDQTYTAQWRDIVWTDYLTDCSAPDTWKIWYKVKDADDNTAQLIDITETGSHTFTSLPKETTYEFKIIKYVGGEESAAVWYTNVNGGSDVGTMIETNCTNWPFSVEGGTNNNTRFLTAASGDYTMTVVTTDASPSVSITYPASYQITFVGNGNDGGSMTNVIHIAADEDVTLATNTFEKTGNHFKGWVANVAVTISGSSVPAGTLIADGATIQNINSNITLTAQWQAQTYTITYLDRNGLAFSGTNYDALPKTHTYGEDTNIPDATVDDDHVFQGWWWDAACTDNQFTGGVLTGTAVTTNVTLYAKILPKACSDQYSFHWGGSDVKENNSFLCFSWIEDTKHEIANYVIENAADVHKYFVGYNGFFYDDGLGTANAKSYANDVKYIPFEATMTNDARPTIGSNATGAIGTLRIYHNSGWDNLYLTFRPNGYGLMYGATGTENKIAFNQISATVWQTAPVELTADMKKTDGSFKYQVGLLKSGDDYTACGHGEAAKFGDMRSYCSTWDNGGWGGNLSGYDAGRWGYFEIWIDNVAKNWCCHFTPMYRLHYDLDGGENANIHDEFRSYAQSGSDLNTTVTTEVPVRDGYTFLGWKKGETSVAAGETVAINADNVVITAQWAQNFTVTYEIGGYSSSCSSETTHYCGEENIIVCDNLVVPTGYTFNGWTSNITIGGKTSFKGGDKFIMPCSNVVFTADVTADEYTITYNGLEGASNPNNPATYTIESAFDFVAPGERAGYTFVGWFDAETDGNPVTGITLGSMGIVTVWAHWTANSYSVTLDKNEGDADGTATFVYNTSVPTSYVAATRNGYNLAGYYTTPAAGGQIVLNADGSVADGSLNNWKTDGKWTRANNDGVLYAKWSAKTGINYTVNHYQMDPDGVNYTLKEHSGGTGSTGQDKSSSAQPKTYEGFATPEAQTLILTWPGPCVVDYYYERNKYKLTWEGLEDATVTGEYTQGQVYHGATITYPTSVSKDGYYFKGWDITPAKMPIGATTITAQWAAYENYRTYCGNAVTFVANGGMGEDYVVTVDADKLTHIPTVETAGFTREGYGFAGWMVDGDESKTVYAPDATINPITDGMIVNAVWISIPTINAAVPAITSTNNVGIASAQRTLTVNNPDGLEATIHIAYKKNGEAVEKANSEFRFCNTGGLISENNIVSSATSIATDFTIQYKPNAYNKIDSDYTLYITVTRKGSEAIVSSAEFNLKGRSLPEKFVIAVKNNSEQWLALPANMTGACTPEGMPITVTGEGLGMTTDVSLAAAYSLTGKTFVKDSVFFTSAYNGGNLWAAKSTSDINDNTADVTAANRKNYEWGLTPTDETLISYNMANKNNGKELKYYDDSKFGMYADGVNTIYFIAVTPKEETTAVVDEWYQNKMLFHLPFAMKSVSMTINGVAVEDDDITIVNRKIKTTGYVLYELGGNIDLVAHSGQVMELTIGDGTTEYVANISIPQIIVGEVVGSTLPAKADVVVRDGGHLTIDIVDGVAPKSFNNVTIYPNSKISVPEGKYFNVKSLTFFGGIDEMNGEETNIYAPELSLKGTMKADTLIYRMRVNAEHMMPVSFPYDVTINKIVREDKLDSPSWGKVGTDIRLETYNGELRAEGNRKESDESTWTEIKEGTLTAGIGYTVAAQYRFKSYLYTILDFPMANPYKDAAAEEAVKNAAVQAHDAVNWYDKGWNLMGNPYMAGITGAGAIKVNETDYDFVYIPTADGEDYYQGPIATAKILPFKDFFVQVNEGGTMYFDLTKRVDAPARMLADIERTAQFSIGLAGANKTDITYFKVADNFTESYDIPGDNAKMFGSAVNTKVYSLLNGEDQLAQMALNADMTAQPIQLGYIAPENGEYIFALDNTYTDYQNVEHIYLLENGEIKVDLLNAQYTFTTEAKTDNERFAILIVMKGAKMPTDLMDGLFDNDVASPKKVIYNDHFYILNTNRRVYDGTGKYINKMQKNK